MSRRRGSPARPRRASCSCISRRTSCRCQLPLRLDRHRLGDPHRGERQLPGLRRSVAHVLGLHAAGRLRLAGAVARQLALVRAAGLLHRPRRRRRLLHQSRATRRSLPEAAELTRVAILDRRCARRRVPDPRAERCARSTARGSTCRTGRSSAWSASRAAARRRWRARSWACCPRTRGSRRGASSSRAGICGARRARAQAHPLARHRLRAAERHELARSGLHGRRAARGGA